MGKMIEGLDRYCGLFAPLEVHYGGEGKTTHAPFFYDRERYDAMTVRAIGYQFGEADNPMEVQLEMYRATCNTRGLRMHVKHFSPTWVDIADDVPSGHEVDVYAVAVYYRTPGKDDWYAHYFAVRRTYKGARAELDRMLAEARANTNVVARPARRTRLHTPAFDAEITTDAEDAAPRLRRRGRGLTVS